MNTKFCTSCQCTRDLDGGIYRRGKNTARWICKPCVERRSESPYRNHSGQITPEAHVRKLGSQLRWR